PGLGGRAGAPRAPPPTAQSGAARRRRPDVGTVDVRALSAILMVHPRGELHVGRPAARRRARGVSCHPTSTDTATDMTLAACLLASLLVQLPAAKLTATPTRPLGTLREQAAIQQQWLRYRLDSVLPGLMRTHGVTIRVIALGKDNAVPGV